MATRIPRTNFAEYWRAAEAVRRDLRASTGSPVAVRQAVVDLADVVAKALEEAAQVAEALSMVVLAQHPDLTRGPRRAERARRAQPGGGRGVARGGATTWPGTRARVRGR
jgi:hypothetical protein